MSLQLTLPLLLQTFLPRIGMNLLVLRAGLVSFLVVLVDYIWRLGAKPTPLRNPFCVLYTTVF